MELTIDYLKERGFQTNHPEKTLPKFYKKNTNPEWRIVVEPKANTIQNHITYEVECCRYDNSGVLIKRTTDSSVTSIEEFEGVANLCGITC